MNGKHIIVHKTKTGKKNNDTETYIVLERNQVICC